jgi:hypothetical protein
MGEQKANITRYNSLVARCRVSFTDSDKAEHAVEVEAESLYEAVAQAVADFREDPLLKSAPGPLTQFTVAVFRNPTEHKISLQQVSKWAEHTAREGPESRNESVSEAFCGQALDDYYIGINAANKSLLIGTPADLAKAERFAQDAQETNRRDGSSGRLPHDRDGGRSVPIVEEVFRRAGAAMTICEATLRIPGNVALAVGPTAVVRPAH